MLSSLPPLFPHDPHTLWYPSLITHPPPTHDSNSTNHNDPASHQHAHHHQNQQQQQQQQQRAHPTPHQPTHLSTLRADELALQMRKANIRRFGAGWLRPPGVGKTLQGMADERAEREEVEGVRAREFALAEAQAAAEAQAEAQTMGEVGEGEVVGERDLDEEVPDADADVDAGWSDDDGGDMGSELEDEGRMTMLEEEEGEGDFAGGEGLEGGDLDDEVPEAEGGSYEHTDTDLEDDSSEDGVGVGGVGSGTRRQGPVLGTFDRRTGEVVRVSGGNGVLGSSVFGSSPVAMRQGGGRIAGRGRGGGGREN